ncbi:uncharacterized protein [Rutidosis leptorrhynchoides]|uniref:uncharacterized protein n=1 Tax=Rutidosis leptorrhynchoides TaxID=125765 RepID=UPI003A994D93
MFRAMSMRKAHGGYEKLISESVSNETNTLLEAKMLRSATLPASFYGNYPVQFVTEQKKKISFIEKQVKKVSKIHPLFSLFERRNKKKKATAVPEFSRYLQYLKEGGIWRANSTKPILKLFALWLIIENVEDTDLLMV